MTINKEGKKVYRKGDIWMADLKETYDNVLNGEHMVIIVSNWKCCNTNSFLNVVPITSKPKKIPVHVELGEECGLDCPSIALCEQVMPLPKERLLYQLSKVTQEKRDEIDTALDYQLGIKNNYTIEMFETILNMRDEIRELEEYLEKEYNEEIFKEREILINDLNRYCINHSIKINMQKLVRKDDKDGRII